MPEHMKIDYLEFPARDMVATKQFFAQVFDWQFTDYGPDYCDFSNAGISGGFYRADAVSTPDNGARLAVFFSESLAQTQAKIEAAGGDIVRAVFEFPGGRRFHFTDPNGNEFAVWSDRND
jgi:predicted enzyme related to lactoylglutathione lyase